MIGNGGHARVIADAIGPDLVGATIIAVGDNSKRRQIALEHQGMRPPIVYDKVIHRSAVVAATAHIGEGTVIMAGAVIQAGARIGKHCIINTGSTVDHDCVIGDYAHIAPGAHLCGHVEVGEGALVGVGVGIAPMAKIPAWVLVKARPLEMVPLYKEMAHAV